MDDARRLREALLRHGWQEGHDLHYVEDRDRRPQRGRLGHGACPMRCASCWQPFRPAADVGLVGPLVHAANQLGLAQPLSHRRELRAVRAAPAQVVELLRQRHVLDERVPARGTETPRPMVAQ